MSRDIQPGVALGAIEPVSQGFHGPSAINRFRNTYLFASGRTKWVRFWVGWYWLFPYSDMVDPSGPPPHQNTNIFEFGETNWTEDRNQKVPIWTGMTPQMYVALLDDQIIQAKRAGLHVILTVWKPPRWATRARRQSHQIDFNGNYVGPTVSPPRKQVDPYLVAPDDSAFKDSQGRLSMDSAVGRLFRFLYTRYSVFTPKPSGAPRHVDFIEVCNEPNRQWEPQWSPTRYPHLAAWFMKLGWKASKDWGLGNPLTFGPATADSDMDANLPTSYWKFMTNMFTTLRASEPIYDVAPAPSPRPFDESDGLVGWSHHNYIDVEHERITVYNANESGGIITGYSTPNNASNGHNSARVVREWLRGNWRGWPNVNNPGLILTEGGARVTIKNSLDQRVTYVGTAGQRDKIKRLWNRYWNGWDPAELYPATDGPLSHGIKMFTNYLFWSHPNYDTGLCHMIDYASATERSLPATQGRDVFSTWAQLPSTTPRGGVKSFWWWGSLGGWAQFSPAIVSQGPGHLEVFVVGGDAAVYKRYYTNGNWSNWESLGGTCTSSIGAVARQGGWIDMFVRSTDNGIWHAQMPNGPWVVYYPMGAPPGGATTGPAACSGNSQHVEIFVGGTDGRLWHKWGHAPYGMSGWEGLPWGDLRSDPAAVAWGNPHRVYAFYKTGPDESGDRIRWLGYDDGVGWRELGLIPGPKLSMDSSRVISGAPAVSTRGRDRMDLFCRGADSCFWRLSYENGAWNKEWEWVGGVSTNDPNFIQMNSEPDAVSWDSDRIDLVGIAYNGHTWTSGFATGT
ncbi:MAG TPA: hypothetical protein VHF45_12300 [Thermoleophilaceae bacterium]|nr:hypothetical protein [Thermoleophilaceae bacterium]